MTEAFPYHVLLYLQVLVDKVRPVCAVCHDTSHVGGGKDYIFRSFLVKEVLYGNSVQQVQFLVASAGQVGGALLYKFWLISPLKFLTNDLTACFEMKFLHEFHIVFHHDSHQFLE